MKGKILSWFSGNVRLRLSGAYCQRFLNLCAHHGITLWNLRPQGEEEYLASVSLKNFWKIKPLVRKCRIRAQVAEKNGLPFLLWRYRSRKPLFISVMLAFSMIFALSLFIWDIRIEGNLAVTDEQIMDYLTDQGITQGRLKSSVDYKGLAASLREYFPEMTWVSVKLEGTRLLIQLQENTDTELLEEGEYGPSDLVSNVNGVVTGIITRSGTPLVKAGDTVQAGDVLVSGQVELINDSAEVYGYQYVAADADIYVQTSLDYRDEVALTQREKAYTGRETSRSLLELGSLHLGFPFFHISYEQYDAVQENRQLRIMENFYLPVFFTTITLREYEIVDKTWTPEQGEARLSANLDQFLKKIQEKGVQIFQNDVKIETSDSVCTAQGTLLLIEKAGVRAEISTESSPDSNQ